MSKKNFELIMALTNELKRRGEDPSKLIDSLKARKDSLETAEKKFDVNEQAQKDSLAFELWKKKEEFKNKTPTPSRFNPVINKTQAEIEALESEAKSRGYDIEKGEVVLNKPNLDDFQGEENPFEAHKKALEEYKKKAKPSQRIRTIQNKLKRLRSELRAAEKLYQTEYSDSLKAGTPIKQKDSLGLFK